MLSRSFLQSSKALPVGIALLNAGLACMLLGILWPHAIAASVSPQWNDFAHGFCIGLSLALEAAAVVVLVAARAARPATEE